MKDKIKKQKNGFSTMIMLYCGLRRGEVLALREDDIVQRGEKIFIRVNKSITFDKNRLYLKKPKSKAGKKLIPVCSKLTRAITFCLKACKALYIDSFSVGGVTPSKSEPKAASISAREMVSVPPLKL